MKDQSEKDYINLQDRSSVSRSYLMFTPVNAADWIGLVLENRGKCLNISGCFV